MYAAIRKAKAKAGTADQLASRIKDAIPMISSVQGFMGYYVIYAPDDTVTAISIFNNVASAEESNRLALAWIEENLGPLLVGPATATAGPVTSGRAAGARNRSSGREPDGAAAARPRVISPGVMGGFSASRRGRCRDACRR